MRCGRGNHLHSERLAQEHVLLPIVDFKRPKNFHGALSISGFQPGSFPAG